MLEDACRLRRSVTSSLFLDSLKSHPSQDSTREMTGSFEALNDVTLEAHGFKKDILYLRAESLTT